MCLPPLSTMKDSISLRAEAGTLVTAVPLGLGTVLNRWMYSAVDIGPSWDIVKLAAVASYKIIGFHPSFQGSQGHKAEDTQPFLCPLTAGHGGGWFNIESLSFAEKGDMHGKTAYSRDLIYCSQRTNIQVTP